MCTHRLPDDGEGLLAALVGREVIGPIQINRVDGVTIDELLDVDGFGRRQADVLQIVLLDRDVAALLDLIAMDQGLTLDLAGIRIVRPHLDAVHRLGIE